MKYYLLVYVTVAGIGGIILDEPLLIFAMAISISIQVKQPLLASYTHSCFYIILRKSDRIAKFLQIISLNNRDVVYESVKLKHWGARTRGA